MDVEKKHEANLKITNLNYEKVFKNILCFYLLSLLFKIEKVQSIIPYYYFPTIKI